MTQAGVKPPQSARRQVLAAGALVLILVFLAGAGFGVYRLTVGRHVLSGTRAHDFGIVELSGKELMLEHTFSLANRSSRRVEIAGVRTSCGCTAAEPSATAIDPGGEVEIKASLKLTRHGKKDAIVFVHYAGGAVDELTVEVEARQAHRLSIAVGPAASPEAASFERVILYMDYDTRARPPDPSASAPGGARVELGAWEQTSAGTRAAGLPAQWKAALVIRRDGDRWPAEGDVVIRVGDQQAALPLGTGGG